MFDETTMSNIQRWVALVCVPLLVMSLLVLNYCQNREQNRNFNSNHMQLLENQKQTLVSQNMILHNQHAIENNLLKTIETLLVTQRIDMTIKKDVDILMKAIVDGKNNNASSTKTLSQDAPPK